ncbi:MAG: hypothetical protein HY854_20550 [Burkholderiales bacterium]|nr:hypothetical protein [Burkholderiales bacterium]
MTTPKKKSEADQPVMPFNEALKRVWSAPPMPKVKAKPAGQQVKPKPPK